MDKVKPIRKYECPVCGESTIGITSACPKCGQLFEIVETVEALMVSPRRMFWRIVISLILGQVGFTFAYLYLPGLYPMIAEQIRIGILDTNIVILVLGFYQFTKVFDKMMEMYNFPVTTECLTLLQNNDDKITFVLNKIRPIIENTTKDDMEYWVHMMENVPRAPDNWSEIKASLIELDGQDNQFDYGPITDADLDNVLGEC